MVLQIIKSLIKLMGLIAVVYTLLPPTSAVSVPLTNVVHYGENTGQILTSYNQMMIGWVVHGKFHKYLCKLASKKVFTLKVSI